MTTTTMTAKKGTICLNRAEAFKSASKNEKKFDESVPGYRLGRVLLSWNAELYRINVVVIARRRRRLRAICSYFQPLILSMGTYNEFICGRYGECTQRK